MHRPKRGETRLGWPTKAAQLDGATKRLVEFVVANSINVGHSTRDAEPRSVIFRQRNHAKKAASNERRYGNGYYSHQRRYPSRLSMEKIENQKF